MTTVRNDYRCFVDSGTIGIVNLFLLSDLYNIVVPGGSEMEKFGMDEIKAGLHKVTLWVRGTWLEKDPKMAHEFDLTEDTIFYIGDLCYLFPDHTEWLRFLKDTDNMDNMPKELGAIVSTGGDGVYLVKTSVRELKPLI